MRILFPVSAAFSIMAATAFAQGNYAEVKADDVRSMTFNHYFVGRSFGGDAKDLEWVFAGDRFTIKAGRKPIPDDLLRKLLPENAAAATITGAWSVARGRIVFSNIKFDGDKPGRKEAEYSIYRTAPTVIRIGEPQYVFGLR